MFCIPPKIADAFLNKIKSKEIDVLELVDMTSAERHKFFSDIFGEQNAQAINALFESKILLKDQQRGFITFIKTVGGLKPEIRRDMLAKVERLEKVLDPKEMDLFMEDLVAQRLGMKVSFEEASRITELAKLVADRRENLTEANRLEYGAARVVFDNYVNDLKLNSAKLTFKETIKNPVKLISDIAGTAKAAKASMDNSAIFRQGWKALMTNPGIWLKNAKKTFSDIVRTIGGKEVLNEMSADFYSRTNSLNGKAKQAGLDVLGVAEEAYPTSIIAKIPVIGRFYKASEVAFTAFVQRTRFDLFDKYIEMAERSGISLDKAGLKSVGKLVNSLTGRGSLGRAEPVAGYVNNVFFSPRLLKSNWDVLTAHQFQKGVTPFVRKMAAVNLVKIIGGTAAILTLANAMKPGSVEPDPRSADFGKIRIGDTRFDVSGGMSSVITLASRLITLSSKSSTTGKVSELNSGDFGSQTGMDVIYNFFENKLSPAASVAKDLLKGQTFQGDKPTIMNELNNLFTPMIITNYFELQNNPNAANVTLSEILDGLGISVNTYSASSVNWSQSASKEMMAFREKVGDDKFKEANELYNQQFNEWFQKVIQDIRYKSLPEEDKQKVLTSKRAEIKKKVFFQFGFKYKAPKTPKLPKL